MSARRFQKFVVEFDVNQKLSLDECRQAFTQSGSGSPVLDLSFGNSKLLGCLAIKSTTMSTAYARGHTWSIADQQFHFDDGRAFNNKLIALEKACRRAK